MTERFSPMELDLEVADRIIAAALQEDLAYGPDVTTRATVSPGHRCTARVIARQPGTIAGTELINRVLKQVATEKFEVKVQVPESGQVTLGQPVALINAATRDLLTAERTLLNLLTHMSGIATATAAWVNAVAGTRTRIRESRQTLPGLRMLQKYSVAVGGGVNHRLGLGDRVLITDSHIIAAGGVVPALHAVRRKYPEMWCEVEVGNLEQLDEILTEQPQEVLLDNFELWQTQIAVQRRNSISPETLLESAGGLSLTTAADYARCGVDYLTVGSLTHSVRALDLGLELLAEDGPEGINAGAAQPTR